ncbi:MAG TPA: sigma-70 family RNA polymerase sigma factor [Bryobacteraceae bacterium]|nr:sigma-70 family RNA polymerase sigma factor [Bryobacteraceae bacterium]
MANLQMPAAPRPDGLLAELRQHGPGTDTLMAAVYSELRQLAHHYLREERSGHTLQATALVHEVYLRLIPQQQANLEDRGRFIGIAAHLMRQVLVDYARGRQREKRGGKDQERVPLDDDVVTIHPSESSRWEELDRALERLARLDPRQSQIVELRYFGGLTVEETAQALGISPKTVKRDWSVARAWLRRELAGPPSVE